MKSELKKYLDGLSEVELRKALADAEKELAANPDNTDAKEGIAYIMERLTRPTDRVVKSGMVKVRNVGTQPINIDGIIIDPAVTDKKGKVVKPAPEVEVPAKQLRRLGTLVEQVSCFLIVCMLLMFATSARAWENIPITAGFTNLNGGNSPSNAIPAASAVFFANTNSHFAMTKYDGTSIQLSAKLMGAGTSPIVACIDASNDATNWVTPYTFISVNANGTTPVSSGTNLSLQHWGFYRLRYVTNASNEVLTNLCVTFSRKSNRDG